MEDDRRISELLLELLTREGYRTSHLARGDEAVAHILREQPDLVILDLGLPGKSGLDVCRTVRPDYGGRILMLTARGDEVDEVVGLEVGADDYLAKPVAPRRLLARTRALLRRPAVEPGHADVVCTGPFRIDSTRRTLEREGQAIPLGSADFDLLWLLARRLGREVSREELFAELRGTPYDGLDRSMDLRVSRLRKALGDDPRAPRWLKTVRARGYLLAREA